jgi:hypothetical protein
MAKIIGLGGIFFKAKSPLDLAKWYKQYLDLDILEWGRAIFPAEQPSDSKSGAYSLWAPFAETTDYFSPSIQNFMVNFIVDDLAELVSFLKEQNQAISEIQIQEQGKFAWILDPEGNKVELWEPQK